MLAAGRDLTLQQSPFHFHLKSFTYNANEQRKKIKISFNSLTSSKFTEYPIRVLFTFPLA